MGRALIGCCPVATANQSSPHSGPILSHEFRLREPLQLYMEEICHDIPYSTDKQHTPWTGMLLMDAQTCIQMGKICCDIFLAYRLGKCHDKFLQCITVVAYVIRTHSKNSVIWLEPSF